MDSELFTGSGTPVVSGINNSGFTTMQKASHLLSFSFLVLADSLPFPANQTVLAAASSSSFPDEEGHFLFVLSL